MKECPFCKGNLIEIDRYVVEDKYVGIVSVSGVWWRCSVCGQRLVPGDVLARYESVRDETIQKLMLGKVHSLADLDRLFVSSSELVEMLDKSRQAIAKDVRLKNVIFGFTFKGHRYYLKESVELFKEKGDGRFPLIDNYMHDFVFHQLTKNTRSTTWKILNENQIQIKNYLENAEKYLNENQIQFKNQRRKMKSFSVPTSSQYSLTFSTLA